MPHTILPGRFLAPERQRLTLSASVQIRVGAGHFPDRAGSPAGIAASERLLDDAEPEIREIAAEKLGLLKSRRADPVQGTSMPSQGWGLRKKKPRSVDRGFDSGPVWETAGPRYLLGCGVQTWNFRLLGRYRNDTAPLLLRRQAVGFGKDHGRLYATHDQSDG